MIAASQLNLLLVRVLSPVSRLASSVMLTGTHGQNKLTTCSQQRRNWGCTLSKNSKKHTRDFFLDWPSTLLFFVGASASFTSSMWSSSSRFRFLFFFFFWSSSSTRKKQQVRFVSVKAECLPDRITWQCNTHHVISMSGQGHGGQERGGPQWRQQWRGHVHDSIRPSRLRRARPENYSTKDALQIHFRASLSVFFLLLWNVLLGREARRKPTKARKHETEHNSFGLGCNRQRRCDWSVFLVAARRYSCLQMCASRKVWHSLTMTVLVSPNAITTCRTRTQQARIGKAFQQRTLSSPRTETCFIVAPRGHFWLGSDLFGFFQHPLEFYLSVQYRPLHPPTLQTNPFPCRFPFCLLLSCLSSLASPAVVCAVPFFLSYWEPFHWCWTHCWSPCQRNDLLWSCLHFASPHHRGHFPEQ